MARLLFAEAPAVGRPGVVAEPAEGFEAAAEAARDGRREPGVRIVEATRQKIARAGVVERDEARVAFARQAGAGVGEKIHFTGKTRERGHYRAARVVFDDELRDENRIGEIGKRVVEALPRVELAENVEVGGGVGADAHVWSA